LTKNDKIYKRLGFMEDRERQLEKAIKLNDEEIKSEVL
jgi:hypothetical protein